MDLITDLPLVNDYNSILVMVDQGLSKGVILSPCAKTITWEGIAKLLQDNLFKKFGLPDRIISDRDPQFAAKAFQELLKLLNVTSSLSTAYHPQTFTTSFMPHFYAYILKTKSTETTTNDHWQSFWKEKKFMK